jgi:hypothetical protein
MDLVITISQSCVLKGKSQYDPAVRLAKSILYNDPLPQEYLGVSALEATKKLYKEYASL